MEKGSINARTVTTTTQIDLENVIQYSVNNYSTQEVILVFKDTQIPIPPATKTLGTSVPSSPFKTDCLGLPFDIDFLIEFPTVNPNNKVIIFYTTKKNCK